MNALELLLIFIVALIAFGPKKLPMLAHHLGILLRHAAHYKQHITAFWQQQLREQQLQENIKKATQAEQKYAQKKKRP